MSERTLIARLNMIDAQVRHEDDLISQRVSWLVISQSFLFGIRKTLCPCWIRTSRHETRLSAAESGCFDSGDEQTHTLSTRKGTDMRMLYAKLMREREGIPIHV